MAVGDIITGVSAANTVLTFQPAAGVEVMVTSVFLAGTASKPMLYDGAAALIELYNTPANAAYDYGNMKMGITNTHYLYIGELGGGIESGFTGIQLK